MFFRTLNHGRKIYNRERCLLLADLCSVVSTPHVKDPDDHAQSFVKRAFPDKKPKAFDAADPNSFAIAEAMVRNLNPALMMGAPRGRH